MRAALIQFNARTDKSENLATLDRLIRDAAARANPDLIVTPELSTFLGGSRQEILEAGEPFPQGEAYAMFAGLARELSIGLHVGSMIERAGDNLHNTAVIFDRSGEEIARYRKIHMFDIETPSGHVFKESSLFDPGRDIVTYEADGRTVGVSICYDIRFAELYLKLSGLGAQIITIPAAFTYETGRAHWEVLCRARAIETQCYVLAPGQIGLHPEPAGERACNGESMIVDPWGAVIARAPDKTGWIASDLDFDYLDRIRGKLPVAGHRVL